MDKIIATYTWHGKHHLAHNSGLKTRKTGNILFINRLTSGHCTCIFCTLRRVKIFLIILLFFSSLSAATGQISFTSPVTQYWPGLFTTDFKEINRSIWITDEEVSIISETLQGKKVEVYKIRSLEDEEQKIIFHCTSRSGRPVTFVVPYRNSFSTNDLYRISEKTGEEIQIRFHLDGVRNFR